jgi:serine/threonine-protein kinase
MRTCPRCQRTYPDDAEFCLRDGTPLSSTPTETEAELVISLAGRYRIVRRLGGGGMGSVFLAEQITLGNRPVALKVLRSKLLDDPEFLLRFRDEAASTARIRHPNVITVYESGQSDDGSPYIAMEYLEGETLRQTLKSRGALSVAWTIEIIQQAARGLSAAHKLGIIHRDLKPDNIFLTRADDMASEAPPAAGQAALPPDSQGFPYTVKIMDFGIAKLRESATHTLTGTVLGTPAYMSSEQASGMRSDQLDARSDIYSLGVVVYEMLTGRVPFHSDTPLGYVRQHMLEEPPPFRAVAPGLPVEPPVEQAVMKALMKDREERYSSAIEFARELARAAQSSSARAISEPPPSTKLAAIEGPAPAEPAAAPAPARGKEGAVVQSPPPTPAREAVRLPTPPIIPPELPPAARRERAPTKPSEPRVEDEPTQWVQWLVLGLLVVFGIGALIWFAAHPG